jgi:5-methylcytosine-specific restriction protein B
MNNNQNKIGNLDFDNVNFYRMALGEKDLKEDYKIYEYCVKNNVIGIGFNDDTDYTKYTYDIDKINKKEIEKRRKEIYKIIDEKGKNVDSQHKASVRYIVLEMKKGDIVLISHGRMKVKAICRITGNYEYRKTTPLDEFNFHQFRGVEYLWMAKNENEYIDVYKIQNKMFPMGTSNKLNKNELDVEFLKEFIASNSNK